MLGAYSEKAFEHAVAGLEGKRHSSDWEAAAEYPITTVIASTADRKIDLLENGRVIAEGRVSIKGSDTKLGSHVFILNGTHDAAKGLSWHAISHHENVGSKLSGGDASEESVVSRLKADDSFQRAMTKSTHPGMVMIVTDNPLHPDRRSGQDFVIMSSA